MKNSLKARMNRQDEPGWYILQLIHTIASSQNLGSCEIYTGYWDVEMLLEQLAELKEGSSDL